LAHPPPPAIPGSAPEYVDRNIVSKTVSRVSQFYACDLLTYLIDGRQMLRDITTVGLSSPHMSTHADYGDSRIGGLGLLYLAQRMSGEVTGGQKRLR
jgi:hypothetical protein